MHSKAQAKQNSAGAALSARRGDLKVGDLGTPAKTMYDWMTEAELEEMAATSRGTRPDHGGT